jgi:hypothetical protein
MYLPVKRHNRLAALSSTTLYYYCKLIKMLKIPAQSPRTLRASRPPVGGAAHPPTRCSR